jgi:tetratricopeptide (TPR) repeat protein
MSNRATAIDGLRAALTSRSGIAHAAQRAFNLEPEFLLNLLMAVLAWQPVADAGDLSTRDSELAARRIRGELELARQTSETQLSGKDIRPRLPVKLLQKWRPSAAEVDVLFGLTGEMIAAARDIATDLGIPPNKASNDFDWDATQPAHDFVSGMLQLTLGRADDALVALGRAARGHPESYWIALGRAEAYMFLKRFEDAEWEYRRAGRLRPDAASASCGRGRALDRLRRYDEAILAYTQATDLAARDLRAFAGRGRAYEALVKDEAAAADYGRAIELDPENVALIMRRAGVRRRMAQFEEAVEDYDSAAALGLSTAALYAARGKARWALGRHGDAYEDLRRAIELDPDSDLEEQLHSYLDETGSSADEAEPGGRGREKPSEAEFDEDLELYDGAIEQNPDEVLALVFRGLIYIQRGSYQDALVDLTHAVGLVRDDYLAYMATAGRADAYMLLQRYGEAAADYERAAALEPNSAVSHMGLGAVRLRQGRTAEALSEADIAVTLAPSNARAVGGRADAYRALGRYDKAVADYARAIQLDDTDPAAFMGRGRAYLAVGRYDEARHDLRHALALDSALESQVDGYLADVDRREAETRQ